MNTSSAAEFDTTEIPLTGTGAQVEWAVRIRRLVNADFDRVATAFRSAAERQSHLRRADTYAILAILEDKRSEVMSIERAGYFIKDWQELGDQVRKLIFADPRYEAIKSRRSERTNPARSQTSEGPNTP